MAKIGDYNADEGMKEWALVTPSDATNIQYGGVDRVPDAIWVGGTGALNLIDQRGGGPVLMSGIPTGTMLRISPRRINATGTTATLIMALWF